MDDVAIARAIHVVAVIIWIGGVAMATSVILPLTRKRDRPIEERLAFFESIESRFVWQARIATILVALSGFYMVARFDLWDRFRSIAFWWMDAMVAVWLIFTIILFIAEPLIVDRLVHKKVKEGDESVFTRLQLVHWVLLAISLITAFAAVAGSHGMLLAP